MASIADALAQSGLAPARLEIEITDSALIGDALETLRAIKALGVRLSLDDFGTGYASLSPLSHHPFAHLKIDRSFIRDLPAGDAPHDRIGAHAPWMIQATASLGRGLGMDTLAEAVEHEWQAELVRQAGVTDLQGCLFGRPTPAADLPAGVACLQLATSQHGPTIHPDE